MARRARQNITITRQDKLDKTRKSQDKKIIRQDNHRTRRENHKTRQDKIIARLDYHKTRQDKIRQDQKNETKKLTLTKDNKRKQAKVA